MLKLGINIKNKQQVSNNKNKILGINKNTYNVKKKRNLNSIKIRRTSIVTNNSYDNTKFVNKVDKIVNKNNSNKKIETVRTGNIKYANTKLLKEEKINNPESKNLSKYVTMLFSKNNDLSHEYLFENAIEKEQFMKIRSDFATSCHKVAKEYNYCSDFLENKDKKTHNRNVNMILIGYNKFIIDNNNIRKVAVASHQKINIDNNIPTPITKLKIKFKKVTIKDVSNRYEKNQTGTTNETKSNSESNLKKILLTVNAGRYFASKYDVKQQKILKIKAKRSTIHKNKKGKKTTRARLSEVIEKTNVLNQAINSASKIAGSDTEDIEELLKLTGTVSDKIGRKIKETGLHKKQKFLQKHNEKKLLKLEKKTDSIIEKKRELNRILYEKSLSKEDKATLERKLGVIKKKEKDSVISNDIKERRINNLLKKNNNEIKKVDRLKKKLTKKNYNQKEKMRKLAQKQQLKAMSRAYIIKKITQEGQVDDTEFILNILKSKGAYTASTIIRRVGKLFLRGIKSLMKFAAPTMAAMLPVIFMLMLIIAPLAAISGASDEEEQQQVDENGDYDGSVLVLKGHMKDTVKNNPDVIKWKNYVQKAVKNNGMDESWTDMVLCIMQQESGGRHTDLLQCGAFTQIESINTGVRILKNNCIDVCVKKNVADLKVVLCCYNHGQSFADYIVKNYKSKYKEEASKKFCAEHLESYNATASKKITVWGDPKYAAHVLQYYSFDSMTIKDANDIDKSKWSDKDKKNVSSVKLTALTKFACKFIGNKYLYGGTDIHNGIDCSGYVQYIFKHFGVNLPRTSAEQSKVGKKIDNIKNAKPGDLLFYANGNQVHHVAIYMGNNIIINASNKAPYPAGGIKTQSADYQPIYCIRRVR